ncbi:YadA-like family protein, partial [Otariodibacter oris]
TTGDATIGGKLTAQKGIDASNQTISHVAAATEESDATNLGQVKDLVSSSAWNLTNGAVEGGVDETEASLADESINPNDQLKLQAGKNLKVKREANGTVTYGTQDNVTFTTVNSTGVNTVTLATTGAATIGGMLNANGGLTVAENQTVNMGGNTIKNVGDAVDDTDAVNKKQLDETSNALTNKGLVFEGNSGGEIAKKLGDKLSIIGSGSKEDDQYSADNVKTVKTDKGLEIRIDKNPTFANITSASIKTGDITATGNTVLNTLTVGGATRFNGGFSVAPNQSVDVGGNRIQNVGDAQDGKDAVNLDVLNEKVDNLTNLLTDKGLNFKGNNTEVDVARKLGETLDIVGATENGTAGDYSAKNVKTVGSEGKIEIQFADNPTFNDITATGDLNVDGDQTVKGDSTIEGNQTVQGDSTINGNQTVKKDLTVEGDANIKGDQTVSGDSMIKGSQTVNKDLTVEGDANIKGNQTVSGDSLIKGSQTVKKDLTVEGDSNLTNLTATGDVTLGGNGKSFNVASNTMVNMGNNVISGVKSGTNATDAANRGDVDDAVSTAVKGLTDKGLAFSGNDGKTNRKLGETLEISGEATTEGSYSGKNIKTVVKDGKVEIQMADKPVFDGLDANGKNITNVADGDISPTSKDAVNGQQLYAVHQALGGDISTIGTVGTTIVNPDGSTEVVQVSESGGYTLTTYNVKDQKEYRTNNVIEAIGRMNEQGIKFFHTNDGVVKPIAQGENTIDSSASGAYSTAVGYQAKANGENAIALGNGSQATGDNTISIGTGNVVSGNNSGAIGDPSVISGNESYAVGNNNVVKTNDTFVVGNNVTTTVDNSVFLGSDTGYVAEGDTTKGNIAHTSQVIGDNTYNYAGGEQNEVVGVVSVGNVKSDGSMQTRRIQNVAPGLVSDSSTDAINGSQLYALHEVVGKGWELNIGSVEGTNGVATNAQPTKIGLGDAFIVNAGQNIVVNQEGNRIDIATSLRPNFNSLTVNPNGKVDMGGNRIQNVGQAVNAGDAVNYGQFKAEVGKIDNRLRAGIAGAVASATLVQAFNPSDSLIAIGAGTYRGASALSLGYSKVSDNGKIIFKVTGSANNYGDFSGGASVGYRF